MQPTKSQRLPKTSIPAKLIDAGTSIVSMTVGSILLWSTTRSYSWYVMWLLVASVIVKILHPFLEWATLRINVTGDGISIKRGLFTPSVVTKQWRECDSIEESKTFGQSRFGLVSLKLGDYEHSDANIEISGISPELAAEIRGYIFPDSAMQPTAEPVVNRQLAGEGQLEISCQPRDILLATTCNFGVIAVIASIITATSSVAENIEKFSQAVGLPPLSAFAITVLAAVAAIVSTVGANYLKYYGLSVRSGDGKITISHGRFTERKKTMSLDSVCGVRITANIVERLLGRYSLSILSSDTSAGDMDSKMTLRALGAADLNKIRTILWHEEGGVSFPKEPSSARLFFNILVVCFLAGISVVVPWYFFNWHPVASLIMALMLVVLWVFIGRTLSTTLHNQGNFTKFSRAMLRYELLEFPRQSQLGYTIFSMKPAHVTLRRIHVFLGGNITWSLLKVGSFQPEEELGITV